MTQDDKIRHDFKNQLAIIRGFAEILIADAESGDPRRRDFEEIHKAAVTALAAARPHVSGPGRDAAMTVAPRCDSSASRIARGQRYS